MPEKIITLTKLGGGYAVIAEHNINTISTMYLTKEFTPRRLEGGKWLPEQSERGYIKNFESKYLDTYERNELGAIKTQWTFGTKRPITEPTETVIAERRGIIHYDHNKKFFVFDDVTDSLAQYVAEQEEKEDVFVEGLQAAMAADEEANRQEAEDEDSVYDDDYESEEEYENAEDSPEYQDDELLNDLQPVENGRLEVDSKGVIRQATEANSNVEILQPVANGKLTNIRNAFPNVMVVRPA